MVFHDIYIREKGWGGSPYIIRIITYLDVRWSPQGMGHGHPIYEGSMEICFIGNQWFYSKSDGCPWTISGKTPENCQVFYPKNGRCHSITQCSKATIGLPESVTKFLSQSSLPSSRISTCHQNNAPMASNHFYSSIKAVKDQTMKRSKHGLPLPNDLIMNHSSISPGVHFIYHFEHCIVCVSLSPVSVGFEVSFWLLIFQHNMLSRSIQ